MDPTCSRIWQVLILTTITLVSRGQPSGCLCVETVTHTSAMQVSHDADLSFNYPLRSQPISKVGMQNYIRVILITSVVIFIVLTIIFQTYNSYWNYFITALCIAFLGVLTWTAIE